MILSSKIQKASSDAELVRPIWQVSRENMNFFKKFATQFDHEFIKNYSPLSIRDWWGTLFISTRVEYSPLIACFHCPPLRSNLIAAAWETPEYEAKWVLLDQPSGGRATQTGWTVNPNQAMAASYLCMLVPMIIIRNLWSK